MPEYQGRSWLAQISYLTLIIALNLIPPCGKSLGAGTENLCKSEETLSNPLHPKAIALKCPKRSPSIVSYGQINLLFVKFHHGLKTICNSQSSWNCFDDFTLSPSSSNLASLAYFHCGEGYCLAFHAMHFSLHHLLLSVPMEWGKIQVISCPMSLISLVSTLVCLYLQPQESEKWPAMCKSWLLLSGKLVF